MHGGDILLRSVGRAGQSFVPGVDPRLSGLHGAGDQEDGVLSRVVLPVEGETSEQEVK